MSSQKKTIQEKLRSDHIDTLAVLSKLQEENQQLKLQIENLLKQGCSEELHNPEVNRLTDSNYDIITLVDENRSLKNENSLMKEKLKVLSANDHKQAIERSNQKITELTQIIQKFQEKERNYNIQISTITRERDEFKTNVANKTNEKTTQIHDIEIQLHQQLELNKDQQLMISRLEQDLILQRDQNEQLILKHQDQNINQLSTQSQEISDLRQKNQELQSQIKYSHQQEALILASIQHKDEVIHKLTIEKSNLIEEIQRIKIHSQPPPSQHLSSQQSKQSIFSDSDDDEHEEPTSNKPNPLILPPQQSSYDLDSNDDMSISSDINLSQFKFKEFIRLKRENRELKLQLTESTKFSGASNRSMVQSSSTPRLVPLKSVITKPSKLPKVPEKGKFNQLLSSGFSSAR